MGEATKATISKSPTDVTEETKPLLIQQQYDDSAPAEPAPPRYLYYSDSREDEEFEDEMDDDDSDLGYSDDSASLSDAYFYPQSDETDLLRPARYHNPYAHPDVANIYSGGHHHATTSVPAGLPNYGAMHVPFVPYAPHQQQHPLLQHPPHPPPLERATSPLWTASSSIHEDVEVAEPALPPPSKWNHQHDNGASMLQLQKKDRKRWRKHQKHHQRYLLQQREQQAARERAVHEVRGQWQDPDSWQHIFVALLFVGQLVAVILCALRFGFGVMLFQDDDGNDTSWLQNHHWNHYHDGNRRFLAEAVSASSELNNASSALEGGSADHAKVDDFVGNAGSEPLPLGGEGDNFIIDYKNVIALSGITGFYACVLTYLTFGFMLILARSLIQIMLVFSILVSLAWGVVGLTLDPYGVISMMGFVALLITLGYTMYVWNRIPFAATNLYTALCAMRCTADITVLGLASLVLAFGWCLIWTMAFVGIVNSFNSLDCDENSVCRPHAEGQHIPLCLLFIFSFFWTSTVIKNVVRTTVASAIGTWWFKPGNISPFCTAAVSRPLLRSLTKALGAICLGSLLVQPAQLMDVLGKICCFVFGLSESSCLAGGSNRKIVPQLDSSGHCVINDEATVDSAADTVGLFRRLCHPISRCGNFCRCCNRHAFSYMGMYGYNFSEAGDRVIRLFETREWVDLVRDNLIPNVLLMASLVIGGSSGVFAVVVEETDGYDFTSFHKPVISAFVIGSVMGFVLSNILLLGVVGSAVDTIMVCFAAGPVEFDKNHPQLSREMREVWTQQF